MHALLTFLWPHRIKKVHSPINGNIVVEQSQGRYRLTVGTYWQSGIYIERLIKKALDSLDLADRNIARVLLLGIGGGSAITVIHHYFPKAKIVGVDIDPVMVKLGKTYFGLSTGENVEIVIADAASFVRNYHGRSFDMIVMDVFIGCETPKSTETQRFITNIYKILHRRGIYICNRSYIEKYKGATDRFVQKVQRKFPTVERIVKKPNLLVLAYK